MIGRHMIQTSIFLELNLKVDCHHYDIVQSAIGCRWFWLMLAWVWVTMILWIWLNVSQVSFPLLHNLLLLLLLLLMCMTFFFHRAFIIFLLWGVMFQWIHPFHNALLLWFHHGDWSLDVLVSCCNLHLNSCSSGNDVLRYPSVRTIHF